MTIPQTWIDGIKNQTQSQAIFQHVDPTDKVSSPAEPVQGGGTVEKCCGNCLLKNMVKPLCGNPACECHSAEKGSVNLVAPTDTSDRKAKIIAGAKDFAERFAPVMKELAEEEADTSDNWRERFFDCFAIKGSRDFISSKSLYEIEAFIEKEKQLSFEDGRKGFEHWVEAGRQQERASLRERIAELKHKRPLNEQGAHLYDRALSDLLDTLKDTH